MKILLINPPHPAIGSRIPREHLPPLGLLCIGGPLLDAGHRVALIDAEFGPMRVEEIVAQAWTFGPDAVLIGHSGSTSGHPSVVRVVRAIREAMPDAWIIYGGVFPTYHWATVLEQEPAIDLVVRGEGEETVVRLVRALESGTPLEDIPGIVFREGSPSGVRKHPGDGGMVCRRGRVVANRPAPVIQDLDACRVGWELIDFSRYTYYGGRRAVVVQFSRGCPHHCHYCGQHGFWRAWRHRDPVRFAAELARLHREHGVELINFADENPTASRPAWLAFVEALIAQDVPLVLIGTTRAGDIVRDADILHLYRRAGVARFLLGLESTDDRTLQAIRKGSTQATDREAIRLLRRHGIISMAAWVAGFSDEGDADYWRTLRQLLAYDPDQIQALYATPHRWTPFAVREGGHRVVQTDLGRWDYKHQVLESGRVPNWRVLLWVKAIEVILQSRPKALWRLFLHPDPLFRAGMRWYSSIGRRVWVYEILQWLFHDRRVKRGPRLSEFLAGAWDREGDAGKGPRTWSLRRLIRPRRPEPVPGPMLRVCELPATVVPFPGSSPGMKRVPEA
jgi:anaerobic magnesium-protoporphyrin IX monomethyl ester cyclase